MRINHSLNYLGLVCTALVLLIAILPVVPVSSQVLKGGVEEENLRLSPSGGRSLPGQASSDSLRITRPPAALQGGAVDATAFAQTEKPQADTNQQHAGIVDNNDFAQPPKNFDIGAERNSREMVLAWEKWHHQLSQAIYTRWQRIARDPGKATIRVVVSRDRHIMVQMLRSSGNPEFDDCIISAIQSLDSNPGLTFPSKSERQQVSFEADYIAGTNVTPGYSWVKNDYERVKDDY